MPLVDAWALSALLVGARVLPLGIALASFTRGFVPAAIALSLTLSLACALLPVAGSPPSVVGLGALLLALLRELCVGATFALSLSFALLALVWAVRASGPSEQLAPIAGHLATAYTLCAAWLALSLGGLRALVLGLAESFVDAPLAGTALDGRAFALGSAQLATDALLSAFGFALPLLVAVWLLSLALALVRRVLVPAALAPSAVLSGVLLVSAAALLLAPIASRVPEAVRHAIAGARALTRQLAR